MVLYKNKYINPFKWGTKCPAVLQYDWNNNRYSKIRVYYAVTRGVSKVRLSGMWPKWPMFPHSVVVRCTGMLCSNAERTAMMLHWVSAGLLFLSFQSFSLRLSSASVKAAGPQFVIFWGPFGPAQTQTHILKKQCVNIQSITLRTGDIKKKKGAVITKRYSEVSKNTERYLAV